MKWYEVIILENFMYYVFSIDYVVGIPKGEQHLGKVCLKLKECHFDINILLISCGIGEVVVVVMKKKYEFRIKHF